MKLQNILDNQLRKESLYVSDDNKIKYALIITHAHDIHEQLIALLLDNDTLKEKFFKTYNGVTIFKQQLFISFLEQKQYLDCSYTKYTNKIGLTINDVYLKQKEDICLVWPFKDCVLEGGQDKDNDQRNEVFFNEVLAKDEITQLLEPKVLTNPKVYTADTNKSYDTFEKNKEGLITDNLVIKGNNLLVLYTLENKFRNKIKVIYIDPPYNTGGSKDTFSYNNTFKHSTWLTFMKNRLEVSKTLLTEDGFLCVAIDHFEIYYLGVLLDEIFGRENKIGIISVIHQPNGRNQEKFFATSNEFMLVYAKNKNLARFKNIIRSEDKIKEYCYSDDKGQFKLNLYLRTGGGNENLKENKPHLWYPIYVSEDLKTISLDFNPNFIAVYPLTISKQERTWKAKPNTFQRVLEAGNIVAQKNTQTGKIDIYEKLYWGSSGELIKTHWIDKKYNARHYGSIVVEKLLGTKEFSYPKSVHLISDTIELMSDKDSIILDFYSGSGTTAHAVLDLNQKDGGKRQFILVEQMDYIESVTCKRIQKVLQKNKEENPLDNTNHKFIYMELKKYNQVFIDKIQIANSTEELVAIWEEMKVKSFLNYNVNIKQYELFLNDFLSMPLIGQKRILCTFLDKNQLYVNYSSLEDIDFNCSPIDKKITIDFYS